MLDRQSKMAAVLSAFLGAGSADAVVRSDLTDSLGKILCDEQAIESPREAWARGIYDAQIDAQVVQVKDLSKKTEIQKDIGQRLNKASFHQAVAAGECGGGKVWVASIPAPKPIDYAPNQRIKINGSMIVDSCRRLKVEFAPATIGEPRTILLQKKPEKRDDLAINLKFLGKGTVSATCYPKSPSWAGPVLWFLVPVAGGPDREVPGHELLSQTSSLENLLLNWINAVRVMHGLQPTVEAKDQLLGRVLRDFAKSTSVAHNRKKITKARKALAKVGYRFIGENRVRGGDHKDLAWLLWNSPSHRKLLLKKDASNINVIAKKADSELFAVLLVTRGEK